MIQGIRRALAGTASVAKRKVPRRIAFAALVGGAVVATVGVVSPASAAQVTTIHMSSTGSDANNGSSANTPVKTLARAEQRLQELAPRTDVEIRIRQGVYVAAPYTWRTYVPGRSISFMPADFQVGESQEDIAGRPIFRGDGSDGQWLTVRLPPGNAGGATNLKFYYLHVEQYQGGLEIRGGLTTDSRGIRVPYDAGANNNVIYGNYFTKIGSLHGTAMGFGAVVLQNSSDNLIRNNHFFRVENAVPERSYVHGTYVVHHSSRNTITNNRFEHVSGDPVRLRNDSNDNVVDQNTFDDTGAYATFSDWFCDAVCLTNNPPGQPKECASHGNWFTRNDIGSGYQDNETTLWRLFPPGQHVAGPAGCDNEGQDRVRTAENTGNI